MRKVLFVAPTLHIGGSACRLSMLLQALRGSCEPCVAVLGADSPRAQSLRTASVRVEVIPWKRTVDYRPLLGLRELVREFRPEVVHAWGLPALTALALSGARWPGRAYLSEALPLSKPSWGEAWLLRRAGRVVAFGTGEAERYRQMGVPEDRVSVLPLAVGEPPHPPPPSPPQPPSPQSSARRESAPRGGEGGAGNPAPRDIRALGGFTPPLSPCGRGGAGGGEGAPPGKRVILGVGPVLSHKGFREAVWSFDILRHNLPDLQLVLVGPGRDRPQVAEFVKWLQISPWVRLVGEVETVRPWLEAADLVWVPSLRPGGVCAALEAMAAGKPVLASRLPGLAEVVADQETGILVRPGDKAALARQSRRLLQDDSLRLQMGEAARKRARDLFGLDRLREEATHLYGHLGALDRR